MKIVLGRRSDQRSQCSCITRKRSKSAAACGPVHQRGKEAKRAAAQAKAKATAEEAALPPTPTTTKALQAKKAL